MAIFGEAPHNLERIKYVDLIVLPWSFTHQTNICAEFERNRWFELYQPLAWFSNGRTPKTMPRQKALDSVEIRDS